MLQQSHNFTYKSIAGNASIMKITYWMFVSDMSHTFEVRLIGLIAVNVKVNGSQSINS